MKSLALTPQETQAQQEIDNLAGSEELGLANVRAKPIALEFMPGQMENIANRAAAMAVPLKAKLAAAQAQRQAAMEVSKAKLGFAQQNIEGQKPIEVGGNLIRLNPGTGKYETVFSAPAKAENLPASYQEYQLAQKEGYKGSYMQYQTEDANRKRPITQVNVGGSGLTNQQANLLNSVINKYNSSPLIQAADKTGVLTSTIAALKQNPGNGAQQLPVIYSYIKALDLYDSAVREGEIGLARETQSLIGNLENNIQKISNGQIVTPETAMQIANSAEGLVNAINASAKAKAQSYKSQAATLGVGEAWDSYMGGFTPSYNAPAPSPGTQPGLTDAVAQARAKGESPATMISDLIKNGVAPAEARKLVFGK